MDEAKIQKAMKSLGITRQEAIEMFQEDEAVDKGLDPHPLTAEQEAVAKKMRQADRKPTVYKFQKRERKENPDKREIIDTLDEALTDLVDDVTVSNPERQIDFIYNGVSYSVTLTAHRPKKS